LRPFRQQADKVLARLSTMVVNEAVKAVKQADLRGRGAAPIETFLAFKYLSTQGQDFNIANVEAFTQSYLVLVPGHRLGRLGLAGGDAALWQQADESGRMTIWNNATRHRSAGLFSPRGANDNHPLASDAADRALGLLPAAQRGRLLPWDVLAAVLMRMKDFPSNSTWTTVRDELKAIFGLTDQELVTICSGAALAQLDPFAPPPWDPSALPADLAPPTAAGQAGAVGGGSPATPVTVAIPMKIAARTERMIRTAIKSASAVILVGPPGSGKTKILEAIMADLLANDPAFAGLQPPLWRTPEESWTVRDVVGAMSVTPPNAEIRWVPGLVPQTIAANRWLVLDEINRGDADRIFGGLITWMSDQDVAIGQIQEMPASPQVWLEWSTSQRSEARHDSQLVAPSPAHDVRYTAGTSWRLLGTYNGQDAQRVFRFGQALGRRFQQVPIPAMEPEDFDVVLGHLNVVQPLPTEADDRLSAIYEAHFSERETRIGPASFFKAREYLLAALPPVGAPPQPANVTAGVLAELFCEAYVVSLGQRLAMLDEEDLVPLQVRLVAAQAITEADWQWLEDQLHNFG
jgi:AAA domain (dynein-related subfamily)